MRQIEYISSFPNATAEDNWKIRKELEKYHYKTLEDFLEMFPIRRRYTLELSLDTFEPLTDDQPYELYYFPIETPADFWDKWERYKVFKSFI